MNDLIIKVSKRSRLIDLDHSTIGIVGENLQEKLVFTFQDDFVDGMARLEYELESEKHYVLMEKVGQSYILPVQNILLKKEGNVDLQLVITEDKTGTPVFKSEVFTLYCKKSIEAVGEAPSSYELWIEKANRILLEASRVNIDGKKTGNETIITITQRDGNKKSFPILDGQDGQQGPEGPQGPVGPQGPEGPQGPVGPSPDLSNYVQKPEFNESQATQDENIDELKAELDRYKLLENALPHTENETASDYVTLNNTAKSPMEVSLTPQTSQETAILPSEYDQLDYLESDAASVINIPFYPSNLTRVITKFSGLSNTDTTWVFGTRVGSVNNEFGFYATTGYRDAFDNNRQVLSGYDLTNGIILDKNKEISTINNTYTLTHPSKTFTCQNTLSIFALNNNGSIMTAPSAIKMYYFIIYENDVLVYNLIPAKRKSDDVLGMYDIIGNQFYTNQGTGTFTYGSIANVPNPDYPQDIHFTTGDNQVKVVGKNLVTGLYNKQSGLISYSFDSTKLTENMTYSFTPNFNVSGINLYVRTINNTGVYNKVRFDAVANQKTILNVTLTAEEIEILKVTNCILQLYKPGGYTTDDDIFEPQFESGSTATSYTPYESTTYPISLGSKEMYSISGMSDGFVYDETEDKFYFRRWNRKIELAIADMNNSENYPGWRNLTQVKADFPESAIPLGRDYDYLCNIHKKSVYGIYIDNRNLSGNIYLNKDTFNLTQSQWKTNYPNLVVILIYNLKNYVDEEIPDSTLISQLRTIKNALSMQGTTHIISTSTGENLPFLIKARAVQTIERT